MNIEKYIFDKKYRFNYNSSIGLFRFMRDEYFLSKMFKLKFGYTLPLDNPRTFNEKLQWLKLYDRNPKYINMVDKYCAKDYISTIIGEQYVVPTYGIWETFDEIDFKKLPSKFVLKCTHDSGGVIICKDKDNFDFNNAKSILNKSLKRNFYYYAREWPYKNVKPRIIAEQYLEDEGNKGNVAVNDYKIMCFNGKALYSFVCTDRFSQKGLRVTFFDREWNKMPFTRHYPNSDTEIPKPERYEDMMKLAEKLSNNIPFLRVDFYEIHGEIFVGELTFFPGSGFEEFSPEIWDYKLGELLILPEKRR